MLKKQKKLEITENTKNDEFYTSPVSNREKRLENIIKYLLAVVFILCFFIGVTAILVVIFPKPILVVDRETGEVIGDYQTSAYRTNDEIIGGSKRFLNYHLSFNSETVYDDLAQAMNMMTDDLKNNRIDYLKKTNLLNEISQAKSKSTLKFDINKIINRKQGIAYVELKGDLIFLAGSSKDPRMPFHFILTVESIPVSSINTAGIKIIYYEEKEVKSESKEKNNTK